jgi:DNA-binding GntR family transcriptional regulator
MAAPVTATKAKRNGRTVDELYCVIRERIIDGTYPPRMRMSQAELAAELKTSRTPLREALNRLQANGLVVATTNRGMTVSPVEHDQTQQWYCLRMLVEPPIIGAIAATLPDEDLSAMAGALREMEEYRDRSARAYQEAHHRFHEIALVRYPGVVRELVESIYDHIMRHQLRYLSRPRIADDFSQTDRWLLKAFRARDGALARRLMEFHLLDAALGLALDESERFPDAMLTATRAIGIVVEGAEAARFVRPAPIRWTASDVAGMPLLVTANLSYEPAGRHARAAVVRPRTRRGSRRPRLHEEA